MRPSLRDCASAGCCTAGDSLVLVRHEKAGRAYWLLPAEASRPGRRWSRRCGASWPRSAACAACPPAPVALAESIAPPRDGSRRHIVHVIYAIPLPDAPLLLPSSDPAVRDVRVVRRLELAELPLHPPIGRFLERWRAGDPFVHLGALWTP